MLNTYARQYSSASPVPAEAMALPMALKDGLLHIYSVLCNAARKAFSVKAYYLRIKRTLFIFIFVAQNRKNNQTMDPMSTRVISGPTSIARKGENNLQKVRKDLSFLAGFENGAYNTKIKKAPKSK